MYFCTITYLLILKGFICCTTGAKWSGESLLNRGRGCLWDSRICRSNEVCVQVGELGRCIDQVLYSDLKELQLIKAISQLKKRLDAEKEADTKISPSYFDDYDRIDIQSSPNALLQLKQALVETSIKTAPYNGTEELTESPGKADEALPTEETTTTKTLLLLRPSTVKFVEDKVEIIKDDKSIKNEIVSASDLPPTNVRRTDVPTPWYQISSKNVFIVVVVVVAVVVLITALIMVLLFYLRGTEDKLKMLDFDNQLNHNGSYRELCRQRYDAKSSERLLSSNGDAPKDKRGSVASLRSNKHPSSVSSWSEEPITSTLDIFSGHAILSYMEDHLQNTTRLDTEWNALCQYQADGVSYDAAMENIRKNRSSALPYDHNRVKLHRDNGDNESDYINASFIIDNDPTLPVYIACQGPLPSTVGDFWQMIWQQKCAAIVMLTPIIECGEVQCARYWPDEGSAQYGRYEVHLVSEHIWCEDYLVRSLYMKNVESGETRTLTQFHFLAFPHDSIPTSPIPLLEMRRKVGKCYRGTNTPIVVHCNDGVGRTGTYMLIDMVLNRIVKGKSREIDVAATLEHLRDQRANVVENKNQLQFALAAVAEEVNAMLKLNKSPP